MSSGLIVGNLLNGYGGLEVPGLAEALISYPNWIFGSVGLLLLAAFRAYFITLWRRIGCVFVLLPELVDRPLDARCARRLALHPRYG